MEKIAKIAGIAIVLLLVAVIAMSYLANPPADKVEALRAFVQISKLYADKKVVDPSKVETDSSDFKYIKHWAVYLRSITDAERATNAKRRIAMQALEAQNVKDPESVARGIAKVSEYVLSAQEANQKSFDAINLFVERIENTDLEDSMFSVEGSKEIGKSEAQYFDKLNSYRVAVGQYLNAILQFIKSREGLYTVEGNSLTFSSPQDQEYMRQLFTVLQKYNNEIDLLSSEHREEIRRELNKLFSE